MPLRWTVPVLGEPVYAWQERHLAPTVRDYAEHMVARHLCEHYRVRT